MSRVINDFKIKVKSFFWSGGVYSEMFCLEWGRLCNLDTSCRLFLGEYLFLILFSGVLISFGLQAMLRLLHSLNVIK